MGALGCLYRIFDYVCRVITRLKDMNETIYYSTNTVF